MFTGVLSGTLLKAGQNGGSDLEARYKRFDKDGDGKVSRKEFVTPLAK